MASDRRQRVLLGVLVVVVVLAVAYQWWPTRPAAVRSTASNVSGRASRQGAASQPSPPDVHIEALSADRPKPDDADRDLFKFKPKAAPPAPPRPVQPPAPVQTAPPPRPGPPPVPAIPLKFIGYIEKPGGQKIASLSDGRGVVTATEGQTVLGQYKIWRIGVESIDISYLDGRGRQTIRMTGQ